MTPPPDGVSCKEVKNPSKRGVLITNQLILFVTHAFFFAFGLVIVA